VILNVDVVGYALEVGERERSSVRSIRSGDKSVPLPTVKVAAYMDPDVLLNVPKAQLTAAEMLARQIPRVPYVGPLEEHAVP
jgi:hypothetical protein